MAKRSHIVETVSTFFRSRNSKIAPKNRPEPASPEVSAVASQYLYTLCTKQKRYNILCRTNYCTYYTM